MQRATLLVMIFSSLTASAAMADENSNTREMARKDSAKVSAKIQAEEAAAITKCHNGAGPEVEACLIQSRGKRMRAE